MTVIMHDTRKELLHQVGSYHNDLIVEDLLYADDTLLVGSDAEVIQSHANIIIIRIGATYGLQINWKKVEALPVRCAAALHGVSGNLIEAKMSVE